MTSFINEPKFKDDKRFKDTTPQSFCSHIQSSRPDIIPPPSFLLGRLQSPFYVEVVLSVNRFNLEVGSLSLSLDNGQFHQHASEQLCCMITKKGV
jgi:hypothetical protein